jgi:hypothetical protein
MKKLVLPSALSGGMLYLGSLPAAAITWITSRRIQIANLLDKNKKDTSNTMIIAKRSGEVAYDTLSATGVGVLTTLLGPLVSTGFGAIAGYNIMKNRNKFSQLLGGLIGGGVGASAGVYGGFAAGLTHFLGKNLSHRADIIEEGNTLITGDKKSNNIGLSLSDFDGNKELWKNVKERDSMNNTFKTLLHKIHNISLEDSIRNEALDQLRKVLPVHFSDINDDSIPMATDNGVEELFFITSKGLSNLSDKKENQGKIQYNIMSLLKNAHMFNKEKEIQNKYLELTEGIPNWYSNMKIVNDVLENPKIENLIRPYLNKLPIYILNKLVWTDERFNMYKPEIIQMHNNSVDTSKSSKELFDLLSPLEQQAILEDFKPSQIDIDEALLKLSFKEVFNTLDDSSKALVLYTINTNIEKADNELLNIIDKHIPLLYGNNGQMMIDYTSISKKLDDDHISNTEKLEEEKNNPKGIFGNIMSFIHEKIGNIGILGAGGVAAYKGFGELKDFFREAKKKGLFTAAKDKAFGNKTTDNDQ